MTAVVDMPVADNSKPLSQAEFERLRDFLRPAASELRWQEISWRTSFWSAVQEAQASEKPILAWAMNGHPLACT